MRQSIVFNFRFRYILWLLMSSPDLKAVMTFSEPNRPLYLWSFTMIKFSFKLTVLIILENKVFCLNVKHPASNTYLYYKW